MYIMQLQFISITGRFYRLFDLAPDEHFCIPMQDFATTRKKKKKSNVFVKVSSTHMFPSISHRPLKSHARGADQ